MTNASEYGKALFLLCEELGSTDRVKADVAVLRAVIRENPELIKLLDTPAVTKEEKLEIIDKAFSTLDTYLVNLLKIMAERRMTHAMLKVLDSFDAAYDESRGIERVEVITAVPLTEEQAARLTERLEKKTGKTIILKNTTDKSVLGGIKLRYMGVQLDNTLKTRLDSFERALKATVL